MCDLCESAGLPSLVASTAGEAWQWKRVKRKTDRDDALKLARLTTVGEIDPVAIPNRCTRQWKATIWLRKRLVSERVRTQNHIRGILVSQGFSSLRGVGAWTKAGLSGLATFARPIDECAPEELWRGDLHLMLDRLHSLEEQIHLTERRLDTIAKKDPRLMLLLSIPGVGVRTAVVIASHLQDAKRFRSADEVSAYPGLVPKQYQSGETDHQGPSPAEARGS